MVLYYSATGNTEYIAKEIARRLDDECVDLLDRIKNQDFTEFHSEKPFIICAPVYVCEMASSTPARVIGIDNQKGYIKEGYDADILLFDDNINIQKVMVMGKFVEG